MKYEWRKKDKTLYLPKVVPSIIDVPEMTYLMISGAGNPNSESFSQDVSALYAVTYGIRMAPKKKIEIPGYFEYTVFPLEGLWDLTKEGRRLYQEGHSVTELKDYLVYTVMIRQPDFVTQELFESIRQTTYEKKKNTRILNVERKTYREGLCCQMLHLGSYDDEPKTFAEMERRMLEQGYQRKSKQHKEIYLSDPSKVAPEKLKTTLRFSIEPCTK
jgi:hypothetical protein